MDSYKFLSTSLDKLAKSLDQNDFIYLKQYYPQDLHIVSRKGIFPYDYIDDYRILNNNCLPSKEEFYSKLNDSNVSDEDYEYAKLVWNHCNVKTLGEYSDIYWKIDVLLLTDIFENYRKLCVNCYHLDAAKFYATAGFA